MIRRLLGNGLLTRSFFTAALLITTLPLSAAAKDTLWLEGKKAKPAIQLNLPSFAPVIDTLGESVVNISTEGESQHPLFRRRRGFSGPGPDGREGQMSPFDFFFQMPPQGGSGGRPSFKTQSLGSGFVLHPDGYIVTNNHVVQGATKIYVTFKNDKKRYRAEIIGQDPKTDIALLKLEDAEGKKLKAVTLGDSDVLRPGDWVIAIGNPFRLGHTATVGIVSAKSRRVPGGGPYDDFIQTDASINPGNSGGPLFNANGEVVGVNTAIYSPGGGSAGFNIGIGFATPIRLVKTILTQLHEEGRVVRGWLGVLIQPVSEDVAQAMKLETTEGALVADVLTDSPADKGGIKRGDVIVRFDGKVVKENDELPLMVAQTKIGRNVDVDVLRGGREKSLQIKIQELEDDSPRDTPDDEDENKLGLSVQEITPDIAKSLKLEDTDGVVVSNVQPDGAAADAGLRRGDVILEVGSIEVNSVRAFRNATKNLEADVPLLLLVKRGENTVFLTIKFE